MNDFRPFQGIRFDPTVAGSLKALLCPPYDIISGDEQRALHDKSPYNVVRLELGIEKPGDGEHDNRYTRSSATLGDWLRAGILKPEAAPAFYLHEQQFEHEGRTLVRRGVLGRLKLASWEEGVVLPHEETLSGPKVDRLRLMRSTACNLSPVFLLFDDPTGNAAGLMEEAMRRGPDSEAETDDGQIHRLWVLEGGGEDVLVEHLRKHQLYVADGHHRYETALAYRDERRAETGATKPSKDDLPPYEFVMALLVDARDPGLTVLPTHRLIHGTEPERLAALDRKLSERFEMEKISLDGADAPATARRLLARMRELGGNRTALGLYVAPREAVVLREREPNAAAGSRQVLDVDVLHEGLLEPLLGIGARQLKAGGRVTYTRDAAEGLAAVDQGEAQAAFLLNPTRVELVLETARAGGKMPQKSTYFFPKPATGLVINPLF